MCLGNIQRGGGSETVHLADRTVKRRIQVLSVDTEEQLVVSRLKNPALFVCCNLTN